MVATAAEAHERAQWVKWLQGYGLEAFYDAFVGSAQGARGTCRHCGNDIFLDIVEGGGIPEWGSSPFYGESASRMRPMLDYGCDDSPDTSVDGVGSHEPQGLAE